jgi:hypothetical protein
MRNFFLAGTLLAFSYALSVSASAQQPAWKSHCDLQHYVCEICEGVGATVSKARCLETCRNRMAKCMKTGCYDFIAGGPRCYKKT